MGKRGMEEIAQPVTTASPLSETEGLTPDTLIYGFTVAENARISPDGTHIMYTLARTDRGTGARLAQLWIADVYGANPRQLTTGGRVSDDGVWSPDGTRIAFVSDRIADRGGPARYGLYVLPAGGGEAQELAGHRAPISGLAWSPEGGSLAYTTLFDPGDPDEAGLPGGVLPPVRVTRRIDYKQDGRGYLGDVRLQLFVVDVEARERRMLTREPFDHYDPAWSPDARAVAVRVARLNGMRSYLGLVDVATGTIEPFGPAEGVIDQWAWSPDGQRIFLAGDDLCTSQTDFFLLEVARGELTRLTHDLAILPAPQRLGSPSQPVWLDNDRVLVHAIHRGASGLYIVDVASGAYDAVARWTATNAGLSVDDRRRYAVQVQSSLNSLGEIVVTDLVSGESGTVTANSASSLVNWPAAEWERIDVAHGGVTIEAWLLFPPGFNPARRYPLVLDVHGGPQNYYGYDFEVGQQALAAAGFLVVFCNPSGSTSYGREFTQRVVRDWGGKAFAELMAVVDAVLERPYADPDRTGILGYSYGGYMTAWTIGHTDRFAAAVCGGPDFDLTSMWGTSDIGHIYFPQQCGGDPHEVPDSYRDHSPSTYAHRTTTPTLIIHGEADERCPIGQSEEMFVALTRAGCETEFVRYPACAHGFRRTAPPAYRADYLTRVTNWFRTHLGEAR
ncbi:prolyl oligopeptidase family serine peptidase [Sinorhizobium meliloti]|nr:prolyl oligopeptidase family serine peptidase [Sinorhizobium meliloti]MDW9464415.1 prolyl oligopeptidase family serine peptidase [Sinorhizobium meliloti]MDW9515449.1 prolyl oligopeptidase family serine peptidase [Sinorhizobium meliloti]MDW9739162.1 prolyl oligopeptidase family serine peptidase [Sinorhizobium meliloti]MDW9893960.1 prolyl oligopeptidase family serine peptidase [Sinorhizobium meliloti]